VGWAFQCSTLLQSGFISSFRWVTVAARLTAARRAFNGWPAPFALRRLKTNTGSAGLPCGRFPFG